MLDSLVRVSRRVGQVTDRFATDAEYDAEVAPDATPRLSGTGYSPRSSNDATRTRSDADREGLPRSASGPTRSESISSDAEAAATFPERLRPPANRSWRSTRRKCARSRPSTTTPRLPGKTFRDADRRATDKLNPTRGLCGPLRLPLNGFTYC